MKQSIQIRLGNQITMTPQLQQAIRLLQLSQFDLQAEIQQNLNSNIMLELDEDEEILDFSLQDDSESSNLDSSDGLNEEGGEVVDNIISDNIPNDLADSDWDDVFSDSFSLSSDFMNSSSDVGSKDLEELSGTVDTLQDHLRWQLSLTSFSDLDRAIAIAIIDAIDEDGYLRASLDEIAVSLGHKNSVDIMDEIETVLLRIQHFDPLGVGAFSLGECLLLQLSKFEPDTPMLKVAKRLVRKHLDLLGSHDYAQLMKRMKLSRDELRVVLNLIQSLNPRPGTQLGTSETNYVVPDVFAKKINGLWKVELNSDVIPKLRINNQYAGFISKHNNRADNNTLKTHLQEARWFIKSVNSRQDTLLKVAKSIVVRQSDFLDYGEEAMKPLVLHDVAEELDMHESTISRVTTNKYLHTPRGIFELKYFFLVM